MLQIVLLSATSFADGPIAVIIFMRSDEAHCVVRGDLHGQFRVSLESLGGICRLLCCRTVL